jgi:hypothetical protein
MKKALLIWICVLAIKASQAQKIDSIYFNLYTDSLKKGFYNYISVDGKATDGKWLPLTPKEIVLTSNTGYFEGNDLFIDSTYTADSVRIKASLRSNPSVSREVIVYIRRRGFTEILKTDDELMQDMKQQKVKTKTKNR